MIYTCIFFSRKNKTNNAHEVLCHAFNLKCMTWTHEHTLYLHTHTHSQNKQIKSKGKALLMT